jgi:hypothetical protein
MPNVAYIARLTQRLDAHALAGYELFCTDLATGIETYLGFLDRDGALSLSGVALPDGRYRVRARASGCFWRGYRYEEKFLVAIQGGVPIYPLPEVLDLGYRYQLTDTVLRWTWFASEDTLAPDDWAIWTSLTEPVNVTGAPQYVVAAGSPGQYTATVAQGNAPLYAVVCARHGATRGAIALLTIPTPPAPIDSPANQSARFTA